MINVSGWKGECEQPRRIKRICNVCDLEGDDDGIRSVSGYQVWHVAFVFVGVGEQ